MNSSSLNVLVVERETAVATAMSATLRRRGHRVSVTDRAEMALSMPQPDVLIAAIELDDMDGLELLETLRQSGSAVRAILTSSLPNLDDCRHAMRLGAAELLAKPLDPEELVSAVEGPVLAALPAERDPLRFRRVFGAVVEDAELAVRDLTAQLMQWGLGPTARARIATAAIEALDNVIRHAYPIEPGTCELLADTDGRQVILQINDRGLGFDSTGLGSGELRDPAQSGLARAASLSEKLRVDTLPGAGTRLELSFAAYRSTFDEKGSIDLSELDWLTPGMSRRVLEILRDEDSTDAFHLSPAMAVTVGRLLTGPIIEPTTTQAQRS